MFNKYKIGQLVLCKGIGKNKKIEYCQKAWIVEKDSYYKDYCVAFQDGSQEWFDEKNIYIIDGGKKWKN